MIEGRIQRDKPLEVLVDVHPVVKIPSAHPGADGTDTDIVEVLEYLL